MSEQTTPTPVVLDLTPTPDPIAPRAVALQACYSLAECARLFGDEAAGQNSLALRYGFIADEGFRALGTTEEAFRAGLGQNVMDLPPRPNLNHEARLMYFKGTGKFYGDGKLEVPPKMRGDAWWRIADLVESRLCPQRLPGLVDRPDQCEFVVLVLPPEGADYGYPLMLNLKHSVEVWSR